MLSSSEASMGTDRRILACLVGLCFAHIALLAWSGYVHSPVNDEIAHLPAGIFCWKYGRFDLYAVNPPLVKMIAAAPVMLVGPRTDWKSFDSRTGRRPEWLVGRDFVRANGARSLWYFTLARWSLIPVSLIGLLVCYRWARDLFGTRSGLVAATLWCFCPNVLANASLITPDAAAAALGTLAAWTFWRWLHQPGPGNALIAGVTLGLAQLAKMTWIVLFGLWPIIWLAWRWTAARPEDSPRASVGAAQLCVILGLGLYTLNAGYEFRGSFTRLDGFVFISQSLAGNGPSGAQDAGGNRFTSTWIGPVPVPLPRDYVLGMDLQKRDFEQRNPIYLGGEHRRGGRWYYYLYGLGVKVPLGTWCLALLAVAGIGASPVRRWDLAVVLAPALAVLVLVSWQHSVCHFRYVLPAFPFVFVSVSRTAGAISMREPWKALSVLVALAASVISSVLVFPHSLSYFNAVSGGPRNGDAHMVGSSLDWGQDLLYLKTWLDEHPEARPLHLAYHGYTDPRVAGIEFRLPPRAPEPGWYAFSVHVLRGSDTFVAGDEDDLALARPAAYRQFLRLTPVARAGYSIRIYRLSLNDANNLRRAPCQSTLEGIEKFSRAGFSPRTNLRF